MPVIGLVVMRIRPSMNFTEDIKDYYKYYVNESNVKFMEQSGAKVIPIRYDLDDEQLKKELSKVNGILIPGHDDNVLTSAKQLTESTKTVFKILSYAEELSATGNELPVFGICLGMQQIIAYICHKNGVEAKNCIDYFQVYATNLTLVPSEFTRKYYNQTIFSEMPAAKMEELSKKKMYYNFHTFSVTQSTLNKWPFLNKEFNVITWSKYQPKNKSQEEYFVTTIQHKLHPWYGIQYHIEKPMYEVLIKLYRNLKNLPEEVEMSQAISDKFIDDCRSYSSNRMTYDEYDRYTIYNERHFFNKRNYQLIYLLK